MKFRLCFMVLIGVLTSKESTSQDFQSQTRSEAEQREIDAFGEKLVLAALSNHPDLSISNRNSEIARKETSDTKVGWLNNVTISGNLNEASINPPEQANNLFFPRYNFSLRVPLGIFFTQPIQTKIAKEKYFISLEEMKKVESEIRTTVLTTYNNYLLRQEIYEMKVQMVEEERAILQSSETKFANGEISLEQYNDANRKYRLDIEALLFAQTNLSNAKLELEQLIGTKLDNIQ